MYEKYGFYSFNNEYYFRKDKALQLYHEACLSRRVRQRHQKDL
jgi:hypothetical protein